MTSSVVTAGAEPTVATGGKLPRSPRAPQRRDRTPLWLLSPAGIVLLALVVVPLGFLLFTSFTDFNQQTLFTGHFQFVWLQQYTRLFGDGAFWLAVVRTLVFTAALVAASVAIGMAVASLLVRLGSAMRYVVTIVLVLAWAMPNVASSQVWLWLFQPGYGVANWLLTKLHIFGDLTNVNWAQDSRLAFVSIGLLIVWQAVPFLALTLYASQTQISEEYLEAARLDGASEWRVYWQVILPFLRPTLLFVTILSIIWDFNVFNQIWLVSQGGPGSATTTLGVYSFQRAFVGFQIGQGSAIAVVTTVLLLIFSAFYIRSLIRSGEEL
jgi:N,N'-diacetylchitobiose transport system permease protein